MAASLKRPGHQRHQGSESYIKFGPRTIGPQHTVLCTCISPIWLKLSPQSWHLYGFSLWVPLKCPFIWASCLNAFPQTGQTKGFSPVWTLICSFRWLFTLKPFPQRWQLCGLSPVWVVMWSPRPFLAGNPFPQKWHRNRSYEARLFINSDSVPICLNGRPLFVFRCRGLMFSLGAAEQCAFTANRNCGSLVGTAQPSPSGSVFMCSTRVLDRLLISLSSTIWVLKRCEGQGSWSNPLFTQGGVNTNSMLWLWDSGPCSCSSTSLILKSCSTVLCSGSELCRRLRLLISSSETCCLGSGGKERQINVSQQRAILIYLTETSGVKKNHNYQLQFS